MLTKCARCGEVFTMSKFSVCPRCRLAENEQLDFLKNYLDTNPFATMDELVRISGVAREAIQEYVRQGRLIVDSPALKVTCEQCGTEILSGRFCKSCNKKLASQFASAASFIRGKKKR